MARNSIYISGQNPDKVLFFWDALLEVYRAANNLYGFTYYKNRGYWHVLNCEPIYDGLEVALRDAKKYCIKSNVKLDTANVKVAVDFSNDSVLYQSRSATQLLGKVEGYRAVELYPGQHDRAVIRHKLEREGKASVRCVLKSLDGKPMEGMLVAELIELAPNTALSVEIFKQMPNS